MTAATQRIVQRALEETLAMQVINLVEVVNADTSDEGVARFESGLAKVVNLHEQLMAACTDTGSPGS